MMASTDRAHEFFWRQAVRWLAVSAPDPVAIGVPDAAEPGDSISVDVDARDSAFAPVPDANVDPPTSYVLTGSVSDSAPADAADDPISEGDTPDEWHVSGKNTSGANARMYAYAVCATP